MSYPDLATAARQALEQQRRRDRDELDRRTERRADTLAEQADDLLAGIIHHPVELEWEAETTDTKGGVMLHAHVPHLDVEDPRYTGTVSVVVVVIPTDTPGDPALWLAVECLTGCGRLVWARAPRHFGRGDDLAAFGASLEQLEDAIAEPDRLIICECRVDGDTIARNPYGNPVQTHDPEPDDDLGAEIARQARMAHTVGRLAAFEITRRTTVARALTEGFRVGLAETREEDRDE